MNKKYHNIIIITIYFYLTLSLTITIYQYCSIRVYIIVD